MSTVKHKSIVFLNIGPGPTYEAPMHTFDYAELFVYLVSAFDRLAFVSAGICSRLVMI